MRCMLASIAAEGGGGGQQRVLFLLQPASGSSRTAGSMPPSDLDLYMFDLMGFIVIK